MEAMREQWTDARLDDLSNRVSDGFNRVDKDLRSLRSEMNSQNDSLRNEMNSEFGSLRAEMNDRFDSLQRTILQVGGGAIATFLIGFASLLVAGV